MIEKYYTDGPATGSRTEASYRLVAACDAERGVEIHSVANWEVAV